MSNTPTDLKYTKSHEWIRIDGDTATVGISDHAQHALGDLVFVELPEVGEAVEVGKEAAVIESVKAASDLYSPLSGEITQTNGALADSPELINDSPYDEGWIFKMSIADAGEIDNLLDADTYSADLDES